MSSSTTLLLGGFTSSENRPPGLPSGLALHRWNDARPELVAVLDILNPTWFVWSERHRLLYVSQSSTTTLSAVRIQDGPESATVVDTLDIGCTNPAHIALAPDGSAVIVACFTGGEVLGITLSDDGRFRRVETRAPVGDLLTTARQRDGVPSEAEPHQIVFAQDGRTFHVPDRAQDVVHIFDYDGRGVFRYERAVQLRPGSGPRHLLMHPEREGIAYLVGELDNSVIVLELTAGLLIPRDVQSTLPRTWFGDSAAAAILSDGHHLGVSNRGHDSLAIYDLDDPWAPKLRGHLPIGGQTPRYCGWLAPIERIGLAAQGSDLVRLLPRAAFELEREQSSIDIAHSAPAFALVLDL